MRPDLVDGLDGLAQLLSQREQQLRRLLGSAGYDVLSHSPSRREATPPTS